MENPFLGRWDITLHKESDPLPAWFELIETDEVISGRYVGIWGSSRPIEHIQITGTQLRFELPPQYEGSKSNLVYVGELKDGVITGLHSCWNPDEFQFTANPAPQLSNREVVFGTVHDLLSIGLEGFVARWPDKEFKWSMADGVLVNADVGTDLVSAREFKDFKLVAEYNYPKGSNSGIYLRGRYEVQILDDFGQDPSVSTSAAVYGFIKPEVNAVRPHGEWNRAEITLVGRHVQIIFNGEEVVNGEIPGITGGALDSSEGEPGPILLQGDHGPVSFRKLELTELI
jgi:hypothetical protein